MLQKSESSSSHSSDKPLTHFGNPDSHQLSPERPPIQLTSKSKMSRRKKRPTTRLVVNIADTHYPIVKKVAKGIMGFKVSRDSQTSEWDLLWTDNAVQIQQLAKMEPHQKINHFPGMFTLSRKNYLARNLDKMAKKFPEEYGFYPQTWILPSELNQLRRHFDEEPNSIVIAKPQASCQGRGIFLSKSIDDFQFGEHYVVQRYLKKPFLIDKLKFDLRIYVLVAGCDPLRLYIYRQGLARFATQSYKTPRKDNLNNMFMHLTNYAINKVNKKFEFNADSTQMNYGHKRSVTSIMQTLQSLGHNTAELWSQICDIIIKTIISVQPILSHHYRSCQPLNYANNMCFEILGFDVILDHNLKPSILQVNYTPSFTTDTPLDTLIKQNLIHDTLSLLNLSNKTKIDTVKARKQQLIERTLTGKQVWLDPIARAQIVAREQTKRDVWQSSHLGNFHKLYSLPDDPKQQCYNEFLKYSEQCYQQLTGGSTS